MNLGERIYTLRTEKEMSQGDLAEAMEVSRQSISKWETNGSVPELEKLVKLSEVFGITLDELVTGKETEAAPATEPQVVYIDKQVEKRSTTGQRWCIALCSLLCVLLLVNLFVRYLLPNDQSVQQSEPFGVAASVVNTIDIDWKAGNIHIIAADTHKITVAGAKNSAEHNPHTEFSEGHLKIQYPLADAGYSELPGRDLIIAVPKNWNCENLKIRGTSVTVDIMDISVGTLELEGSSSTLTFSGSLDKVKINGTSVTATLNFETPVSNVMVGGNRCSVSLTLPKGYGFQAYLPNPNCEFHSDLSGVVYFEHRYSFGDRYCKILPQGSSCDIFVTQSV